MMIEVTWMQPYQAYMINKQLTEDVVTPRWIVQWSKSFVVIKGELYRRVFQGYYNAMLHLKKDRPYCKISM
jgi:hypothetical protein